MSAVAEPDLMVTDAPAAEAPAQENPEVAEHADKSVKINLRLDNGTIVRFKDVANKAVEVLDPETAWKAGLLTEEHLLRIQSYLCEVHAKLPDEGPLKSVSLGSKRSMDTVLEAGQFNSAKKTKSTGLVAHGSTPIASPGDVTSRKNMDFPTVARKLIRFIQQRILGKEARVFSEPVDGNVILDYYEVVKNPMTFNTILGKLDDNEYTSPKEFYDDVLLVCDNCYLYNVQAHPFEYYGLLGIKMENAFLKAWEKTPFAATVPPRPQRPIPTFPKEQVAKPSRPASAGRVGRVASAPRPKATPKIYMTPEMENDLVTALNTPAILEANMEAVVEILTVANEMGTDEDGEPSLDLEKVSAPTKRKLYDLVVKKPVASQVAKPTSSGFKMEDDDYDPEDEDM